MPTIRKDEGGSYFDDEMMTKEEATEAVRKDMLTLVEHLNQRPDHTVYVSGPKDRVYLRSVFNEWKRQNVIAHNPNIRIDYGVRVGAIRIGDGR